MSTRICPVCGADYLDWVETCSVCGVPLVAPRDAPDPLRLPVEQQVVYELGAWPLGLQAAAAQAMAELGVPHGWDGTDLVIHVDHEEAVDALLEAIEQEAPELVGASWSSEAELGGDTDTETYDEGLDGVVVAPLEESAAPDLEPGAELEYELDEWPATDRDELAGRLEAAGVAHRWEDETVLVVPADHEELVEALLDEVEFPDALPDAGDGADDETPFELMSELFVAADRLRGNPHDPDGIEGLSVVVDQGDPERPPFGVDPELWRKAIAAANDLADRLAGAADRDGDGVVDGEVGEDGEPLLTADDVAARAGVLRDLLRPFV